MTMGERIRERRKEKGLTQAELAQALGTTKQAIYKYETGVVTNIPRKKMAHLAELLGVTPGYLLGWEPATPLFDIDEATESTASDMPEGPLVDGVPLSELLAAAQPISTQVLPLLGDVACGEPIYVLEEYETYLAEGIPSGADFCLRARGDSMIGARIFDGDILYIKQQDTVDDGEIALVLVGDEATVKRVYFDRSLRTLTLQPENPTYRALRYTGPKLDEIRILGKVVAVQFGVK